MHSWFCFALPPATSEFALLLLNLPDICLPVLLGDEGVEEVAFDLGVRCALVDWEGDEEGGAVGRRGDEMDFAAVGLDHGFGNGGAEAGAAVFAVGEEGFPEAFLNSGGDAGAVVADLDQDASSIGGGFALDGDLAVGLVLQGFDGVADDVLQDAQQFFGLTIEFHRFDINFQRRQVVGKEGCVEELESFDQFAQIDLGEDGFLAGAGEFADFRRHVRHALNLGFDVLADGLGALVGVELGEDLGVEGDEVERVFEIVEDAVNQGAEHGEILLGGDVAEVVLGGGGKVAD